MQENDEPNAWLTPQLLQVTTDVLQHSPVDPLHILHTHFAAEARRATLANCAHHDTQRSVRGGQDMSCCDGPGSGEALEVCALLCTRQQAQEHAESSPSLDADGQALYDRLVALLRESQTCRTACNSLLLQLLLRSVRDAWTQELHALSLPSKCEVGLVLWGVLYALRCCVACNIHRSDTDKNCTVSSRSRRSTSLVALTMQLTQGDEAAAGGERCLGYLLRQRSDADTSVTRNGAASKGHRLPHKAAVAADAVAAEQRSEAEKGICAWIDTSLDTLYTQPGQDSDGQVPRGNGVVDDGTVYDALVHTVGALRALRTVAVPLAMLLSAHGVPGDFTAAFHRAWGEALRRRCLGHDTSAAAASDEAPLGVAYRVLCARLADELRCTRCVVQAPPQSVALPLQTEAPRTIAELWCSVLWWVAQLVEQYTCS